MVTRWNVGQMTPLISNMSNAGERLCRTAKGKPQLKLTWDLPRKIKHYLFLNIMSLWIKGKVSFEQRFE